MNKSRTRLGLVLLSPVLIIIIGNFAAHFFVDRFGNWAWAGYFPLYWGMLFLSIVFLRNNETRVSWFKRSQGSRWWILLAIAAGLISFPALLVPNFRILNSMPLIIAWLIFAIINSVFEEAYWRGFILDETAYLPRVFGVAYSTILFTVIHPANLGVFSKIQAFNPARPFALVPFITILIILTLILNLLYLKTKSLRYSILSHILTDLGNMSVFLFMNMVIM